jgi:hypothetical protein
MKKFIVLALASTLLLMGTVACVSQSTLATLVTVLGNATSSIAAIEGTTSLATQIKADTAAASSAVLNWKKGTPAQEAIQALNIVEDDLNLIPATGPYVALIDLGIGTVESILELLPQPTSALKKSSIHRRSVNAVKITRWENPGKEFKERWNKIVATDGALAPVAIK